jgi:hypothetical protein
MPIGRETKAVVKTITNRHTGLEEIQYQNKPVAMLTGLMLLTKVLQNSYPY